MSIKFETNTDFGAFVKRQQSPSAGAARVDWQKERDEWLSHLQALYDQVASFLDQYLNAGEIQLKYQEIELNEENIGSYRARKVILKIGRQEITLTPVGTLLIGAKGRVDVVGPAGRTRLLLVDSKATRPTIQVAVSFRGKSEQRPSESDPREIRWAWKIATSPPAIQYIELTRDSFFQVLMEVANG